MKAKLFASLISGLSCIAEQTVDPASNPLYASPIGPYVALSHHCHGDPPHCPGIPHGVRAGGSGVTIGKSPE